jgi:hypothetical protein
MGLHFVGMPRSIRMGGGDGQSLSIASVGKVSGLARTASAPPGNRALNKNALLLIGASRNASDMTDLDPKRFTLRQAAQARDDFAQVMDELELMKSQLARLPTRRDQAFTPLRIMFGSALLSAALVILWLEAFWRHCL